MYIFAYGVKLKLTFAQAALLRTDLTAKLAGKSIAYFLIFSSFVAISAKKGKIKYKNFQKRLD